MTLYCKVALTDLWGLEHDVVPTGAGGSEVLKLNLPYGAEAKSFLFHLQDVDVGYAGWLVKGCIVKFYVDSSSPPTTLVLTAMVEDVVRTQKGSTSLRLTVSGREFQYIKAIERIGTEAYLATSPSTIIRDLLNTYLPYPADTVLAMSFYEGAGTLIHDESTRENNGTLHNATFTTGKYSFALHFNPGATDYIDIPNFVGLETNGLTIEAWVKIVAHSNWVRILSLDWANPGSWVLMTDANGDAWFSIKGVGGVQINAAKVGLAIDTWYHIVGTYDGSAINIYVDGVAGSTESASITLQTSGTVYISGDGHVEIDEVRMFNRALTAQEVLDHYTHGYLHHIAPAVDTAIEDIRFNYRKLKDCLDTLAKVSSSKYYWTPTGAFRFLADVTVDSGVDYTDADLSREPSAKSSLIPIKNRVYIIGGLRKEVDQSQETVG